MPTVAPHAFDPSQPRDKSGRWTASEAASRETNELLVEFRSSGDLVTDKELNDRYRAGLLDDEQRETYNSARIKHSVRRRLEQKRADMSKTKGCSCGGTKADGKTVAFNPNHDERGRFSSGSNSGGGGDGEKPPRKFANGPVRKDSKDKAGNAIFTASFRERLKSWGEQPLDDAALDAQIDAGEFDFLGDDVCGGDAECELMYGDADETEYDENDKPIPLWDPRHSANGGPGGKTQEADDNGAEPKNDKAADKSETESETESDDDDERDAKQDEEEAKDGDKEKPKGAAAAVTVAALLALPESRGRSTLATKLAGVQGMTIDVARDVFLASVEPGGAVVADKASPAAEKPSASDFDAGAAAVMARRARSSRIA